MREPWEKPEHAPEALAEILKGWVAQIRLGGGWQQYKVFIVWEQITDEKTREHTTPLSFAKQVLKIKVDSPAHYFELANFKKTVLLKDIQDRCPDVYVGDIHFIFSGNLGILQT